MVVSEEGVTIVSINGAVVNGDSGADNTDTKGQIRVVVRVDDETAGSLGGLSAYWRAAPPNWRERSSRSSSLKRPISKIMSAPELSP